MSHKPNQNAPMPTCSIQTLICTMLLEEAIQKAKESIPKPIIDYWQC